VALAQVLSRACVGAEAPRITVEAHMAGGLPCVSIVGRPEADVWRANCEYMIVPHLCPTTCHLPAFTGVYGHIANGQTP